MRFKRTINTEASQFIKAFGIDGSNVFYVLESTPEGRIISCETTDPSAIAWLRSKNIPEV